jgi:hypothetical protein
VGLELSEVKCGGVGSGRDTAEHSGLVGGGASSSPCRTIGSPGRFWSRGRTNLNVQNSGHRCRVEARDS